MILNSMVFIIKATCDFEDPSICGYKQLVNDNFDWTRKSGATGTSRTGPSADHSYGTLDGKCF